MSPSQIRNLERDLATKVIDRTMLILDIFGRRAKTREAQMQVELAQLQYMLPRLVGLHASLSRQGGGTGGGFKTEVLVKQSWNWIDERLKIKLKLKRILSTLRSNEKRSVNSVVKCTSSCIDCRLYKCR